MATLLPWEIIIDSLCRLPVKDLLRYRSVAKPWRSLIDGPDFIKLHLTCSLETTCTSNLGAVLRARGELHWLRLGARDPPRRLSHPIDNGGGVGSTGSAIVYLKGTDQVVVEIVGERFILYDLGKNTAENLGISGLPEYFQSHFCVSSLVKVGDRWG